MRLTAGTGHVIKKALSLSLFEQGILSAFNLVLGLLLIRSMAPEEFGVYSVVVAACLTLVSAQGALVGVLAVLRPAVQSHAEESTLLATCSTANACLSGISMLVTAIGMALVWHNEPLLAVASALYVGGVLLREYVRIYLFSALQIGQVIIGDVIYIAISAVGLYLTLAWRGNPDTVSVCVILGLASALSSGPALAIHAAAFRLQFDSATRDDLIRIWHKYSRWMVLGAVVGEIQQRAYVFVVAAAFGPVAVGTLQAAAILFRPVILLMLGWGRVACPAFARLYGSGDLQAAHKFARVSAAASVVLNVCFLGAIWAAWSPIEAHIFRGSYQGIETVVALWGLATVIWSLRGIYSAELQGFARFRELGIANFVGTLVSLVCLLVTVYIGTYQMTIIANIPAYFCELAIIAVILRRVSGRKARSGPSDATGPAVAVGRG